MKRSAKIVHLVPPILSSETIQENIICTRPMREGKFNISIERNGDKTIVNCYGHGGSGWTTLFGSIRKAIKLFTDSNPNKATPIKIIGSGCMGLTMAIELTRLGYQVTISTKNLVDIPSWRAAGYFALVSVHTSPEEQEELNQIIMDTFQTYQKVEQGHHPYITKEAVRYMPVYCSQDTQSGVADLEAQGKIPKRELVTLDFGNNVRHKNFVKFMTYFMNTTTLMKQLHQAIKQLSIPIIEETIDSIDTINESVVFNCTGLGAHELNGDEKLIPVTGHLQTFSLKAGQSHMEYMIYTVVQQNGKDEYIYLSPQTMSISPASSHEVPCAGVLGGTFIKNVDKLSTNEQTTLHQREFMKMRDRACQFFLGHPYKV